MLDYKRWREEGWGRGSVKNLGKSDYVVSERSLNYPAAGFVCGSRILYLRK